MASLLPHDSAAILFPMLEPHQRAAVIPNDPGVNWHSFIKSRFVDASGEDPSLAIVVLNVAQQDQTLANLRGLVELSLGGSLPVVSEFAGVVNLESREISIHQTQPQGIYAGQLSGNGRVMVLREAGQSTPIHLVHEQTLAQLV